MINTPAIAVVRSSALLASAAQLFTRGGTVVEVSNGHNDYFPRNKDRRPRRTRRGQSVYRPSAFGRVAGL